MLEVVFINNFPQLVVGYLLDDVREASLEVETHYPAVARESFACFVYVAYHSILTSHLPHSTSVVECLFCHQQLQQRANPFVEVVVQDARLQVAREYFSNPWILDNECVGGWLHGSVDNIIV